MSKHRRIRMTRVDAERLLDTGVGGPEPLATLLAAVTPSPASSEVTGERGALTEFRAAHFATARSRRARAMLKSLLADRAAKVTVAATAAVAATGGIAVAAVTGHLPGTPHHQDRMGSAPTPTTTHKSSQPSHSAAAHKILPAPKPSDPPASHRRTDSSPWLPPLCRAFQANATENPRRAIDHRNFSVLVSVAGGMDSVADFCVRLIGPARTHSTGPWPTDSRHPWPTDSTHPRPADSTHPWPTDSTHPGPTQPSRHWPNDSGHHQRSHSTGSPPPPHSTGAPVRHPTGPPSSPGQP